MVVDLHDGAIAQADILVALDQFERSLCDGVKENILDARPKCEPVGHVVLQDEDFARLLLGDVSQHVTPVLDEARVDSELRSYFLAAPRMCFSSSGSSIFQLNN